MDGEDVHQAGDATAALEAAVAAMEDSVAAATSAEATDAAIANQASTKIVTVHTT